MKALKEFALPFDGIPCKVCGAPIPANLLACPECCGLEVETRPGQRKPKPTQTEQPSLFHAEYPV